MVAPFAVTGLAEASPFLGMGKIIGDDSLRPALGAIAPAPKAKHSAEERAAQKACALQAEQWMQGQLRHSIAQATKTGWILDCDTTVKVLYGHQDGAVVSYNPQNRDDPVTSSTPTGLEICAWYSMPSCKRAIDTAHRTGELV